MSNNNPTHPDLEKRLRELCGEMPRRVYHDEMFELLLVAATLGAEHEREQCVKVVDRVFNVDNDEYSAVYPEQVIAAIRARGNSKP